MKRISFYILGIGTIMTMIACTPPALEINLPEENRRVINSLRVFEMQKAKDIRLENLLTFPKFHAMDLQHYTADSSQPMAQKKVLEAAKGLFESEQAGSLGEEAEMFSIHPNLQLIAVGNASLDMVNIFRLSEGKLVEINLLYIDVEDMRLRFKKLALSENATLKTAIEKGAFDRGSVFMMEQAAQEEAREGESY
ncbi:MAG: hypothetical protein HQM13_12510 [SAR324 cluster bacterium]|nr:hypothetical protein [SAR324 cluster bacterium]